MGNPPPPSSASQSPLGASAAKIDEIFPCGFLPLLRKRSCRHRIPRYRIHGTQGQVGVSESVKVTMAGEVPLPEL